MLRYSVSASADVAGQWPGDIRRGRDAVPQHDELCRAVYVRRPRGYPPRRHFVEREFYRLRAEAPGGIRGRCLETLHAAIARPDRRQDERAHDDVETSEVGLDRDQFRSFPRTRESSCSILHLFMQAAPALRFAPAP